jgi:hypothetical protein
LSVHPAGRLIKEKPPRRESRGFFLPAYEHAERRALEFGWRSTFVMLIAIAAA